MSEFGTKRQRAVALIRQVVQVVDRWQDHFVQQGVGAADMELLRACIDRDGLLRQRQPFR